MPESRPLRLACGIGQLNVAGSEQQLVHVLQHLDRSRFAPEVWVMSAGGDWEQPLRQMGIEVLSFYRYPKHQRPWHVWRAAHQRRLAVWWSWGYYTNWYAHLMPGFTATIGSLRTGLAPSRALVGGRYRLCEARQNLLLANFREGLAELRQAGYRGEADWVGNACPPPAITPALKTWWRERLQAYPDARLLIAVGRLDGNKNYGLLLETLAQIPGPHWHLAIIGEGRERAALQARAAYPDLAGRIVFAGQIWDAAQAIAAADLLVHPSRMEGMPNVVLEALVAAVPVVATQVNGIRDLIPSEEYGWVVPQDDAQALGAAICAALANPAAARAKAGRAQERARKLFDPARVTGLLEDWVMYAAGRGHRPPPFDQVAERLKPAHLSG